MEWFEVMLDDVQELGRFIEVALESDEGEKEAARKKIIDFIKKLGIDEKFIEKRGYGEIMGEKLGHRFEGMR
jgi:predicted adenylyl cyclase CyaB